MSAPENPGPKEGAMRCAVSERFGAGLESGHGSWPDLLREAGIEFIPVPDSGVRLASLMEVQNVEAVLLSDGSETCVPGAGIQDGSDFLHHRTGRELVRFARARRLPLVGIGHGAEFLGLYFGGRLRPHGGQQPENRLLNLHIAAWAGSTQPPVHLAGRMICDPNEFPDVLDPFAWDEHGNIAGFVHRDEPILGIHWQPVGPTDRAAELVLEELCGSRRVAS
jgi:anthranilate/para-aminobenzoate synthase component II